MTKPLPPVLVLGRIGPVHVGAAAAGVLGACALTSLLGILHMVDAPLPVLVSDAGIAVVGGGAARWVLRAPAVGPGRCFVAGVVAGLTAAIVLVSVSMGLHEGESSGMAGVAAIMGTIAGAVLGGLVGVSLTPLARAIVAVERSSALDRTDRALAKSAWWLLIGGAVAAALQAPRSDAGVVVGWVAIAIALASFVLVATREHRRRRRLAEAGAAPADGDQARLAIVSADALRGEAAGAESLVSGDPGAAFLVEHLVPVGPIFRAAADPARVLARVTPARARWLLKRRAIAAEVGGLLAAVVLVSTAYVFRDALHYRYRSGKPRPARVDGFDGDAPRALAARNGGVCAITRSDHVRCFGNAADRFIGFSKSQRYDAMMLPGLEGVSRLALGRAHACMLQAKDDLVRCWGDGYSGGTGAGNHDDQPSPIAVRGLADVTDLALGDDFSVALRRDGTVWQWGADPTASGPTERTMLAPVRVDAIVATKAVAIAAAGRTACAILEDRRVTCWGSLYDRATGAPRNGSVLDAPPPPYAIPLPPTMAVRLTPQTGWAIAVDGSVWVWGHRPERPDEGADGRLSVRRVEALRGATEIAPGTSFACGLSPDGTVPCVGLAGMGALGDGSKDSGYRETHAAITDVATLAADADGVCATKRDGSVWCWGRL